MLKVKNEKTQKSMRTDYLICLIAITVLSVYYYGYRALAVTLIAIMTSFVTDIICIKLIGNKDSKIDTSPIISALIFSMLLPASVPYSIVIASCIFMIIVGKQVFGGNNNRIFNCVAVAFCFATLCFKENMFLYPTPVAYGQLDMSSYVSDTLVSSFTQTYSNVSDPSFNIMNLLLGKVTGPMGATCIILIALCAIILIARKSISFLAFISFVGTILAVGFFFPQQSGISRELSVVYQLFSSAMLFSATFLVSDLNFLPKRKFAKIIYGISVALISTVFIRYAKMEIGVVFALVILNPMCNYIDTFSVLLKRFIIWCLRFVKKLPFRLFKLIVTIFSIIYILITRLALLVYKKIKKNNSKRKIIITETLNSQIDDTQKKEEEKIEKK